MNILPKNTLANVQVCFTKTISSFIVDITTYLWIAYFTFFLKGKVHGSENIPKTGCILAMNHVSYLDFILCYSIFRRKYHKKVVFIGKAKLLNNFLWRSYLIGTNSIIIDYSSRESIKNILTSVKKHLEDGAIIGLFPEGTRSPNGKLQKAQEGIGHILINMNFPVVPIGLIGFYEAWPRDKKYPGISSCTIQIGEPIIFNLSEIDRRIAKSAITESVMQAIAKLIGDSYSYFKLHTEFSDNKNLVQNGILSRNDKSEIETNDLILFDLDGTLINGQTQKIFLDILKDEKIITLFDYSLIAFWFLTYKLRITSNTQRVRNFAYKKLANRQLSEIERIIEMHFPEFQDKIFNESFDIINKIKQKGHKIVIISASIEPIVKRICEKLDVDEYICTKMDVSNGNFSGKYSGVPVYGHEKINQIKNYLSSSGRNFNKIQFYNDHFSDISLMEFVDIPICVNPDKQLKRIAIKKNWEILHWEN